MPSPLGQSDDIERLGGGFAARAPAVAGVLGGERDVLQGGEGRDEVVRLEHEPQLLGSNAGPSAVGETRHLAAADDEARRRAVVEVGLLQESEDLHERALAGTRGAHDRDHLAGLDRDVHAAQSLEAIVPAKPEGLVDVAGFKKGHVDRSYSCRRARTGSSRAACVAGTIPATIPRAVAKMTAETAVVAVRLKSTVPEASPAPFPSATAIAPRPRPRRPPRKPMRPASATSSPMIRRRRPPIARLIPISRVRSLTDMAIVLTTDKPPTTRLIKPTPTMMPLRRLAIEPIVWSNSLAVTAVTLGKDASMRSASWS